MGHRLHTLVLLAAAASILLPMQVFASTFVIQPESSYRAGQTFSLLVTVDPFRESHYTVRLDLDYPEDLVEVLNFNLDSDWIPLIQPQYDLIDNDAGHLVKTAGFPGGFDTPQTLGIITFRAKDAGSGTLTINNSSVVLNVESTNTLSIPAPTALVIGQPPPGTEPVAAPSAPGGETESQTRPEEETVPGPDTEEAETTASPAITAPENLFDVEAFPAAKSGPPVENIIIFILIDILVALAIFLCVRRIRKMMLLRKLKRTQEQKKKKI